MSDFDSPLRPTLDLEALKSAFESLRRVAGVEGSPLLGFVLVRQHLDDPAALHGQAGQTQAVYDVLLDVLTGQYATLRKLYGLPPPDLDLDLQQTLGDLALVGSTHSNNLLLGYSVIYYRYARADLELSLRRISHSLGQRDRSVRRYTGPAWRHLRQTFIRLEIEARTAHRQMRCLLALPRFSVFPLKSQQRTARALADTLRSGSVQHLLIHGLPGVGKSTLALQIGESLTEQQQINEVAWVNLADTESNGGKPTGDHLIRLVCEALQLHGEPAQRPAQVLRNHLSYWSLTDQRLLLILDNADGWQRAVQDAWSLLSHCVVVVTACARFETWMGIEAECPALEVEEAFSFLEMLDKQQPYKRKSPAQEDVFQQIWQAVGGNPATLKRAFRLLPYLPPTASHAPEILLRHYQMLWERLPVPAQDVYVLATLLSTQQETTYEQLAAYAAELLDLDHPALNENLATLLESGLLEWAKPIQQAYVYRVPVEAIPFVREASFFLPAIQHFAAVLLARIPSADPTDELALGLLSALCLLGAASEQAVRLARPARQMLVKTRQWGRWLALLQRLEQYEDLLPEDRLWLGAEKAVALRGMGLFDEALSEIVKNSLAAQETEEFAALANALVEQSNVLFYRGNTELAAQKAREAHAIAQSSAADALTLEECTFALAQALSRSAPEEALKWIETIQRRDAQVWDLLARIEMALDPEAALAAAKRAVASLDADDPAYARSIGILARALAANGALAEAIEYFQLAINLLHHRQDTVGLARMHNNLGVAYLERGDDDHARRQFEQSLALHKALQDSHGQAIALENLQYIGQRRLPHWRDRRFL